MTREKKNAYNRAWDKAHPDKKNATNNRWRKANPDKVKLQNQRAHKKQYQINKTEILKKNSKYKKERRKTDPYFRLVCNLRRRVSNALKGITKSISTEELLGAPFDVVKAHITAQFKEGMTWENHGKYSWHIDHIIPCDAFDLTDPEQQKKCFHYTNLQPLWAAENLIKGAKII